jgi:hypothetical protein
LFNSIDRLIDAAVRSNLQSVLTDCPHREKLGWLEVAHLMGPSLVFRYDLRTFYRKVLRDMRDAQTASGLIPDIAPEYVVFEGGFRDSPEWGGALFVIPQLLRQWYGDQAALAENFDAMARYAAYLGSKTENHILSHGLGDWYDIGPGRPGPSKLTPKGITATAIYYHGLRVLEDAARMLGRADADRFSALAAQVREAFTGRFYDAKEKKYSGNSQTGNAIPLVLGLAPEESREALVESIVRDIRERGNHPSGGDVGHRFVILALMDSGRAGVLFDMTNQTEPPSYGAQIKNGATSLTEAWDANPLSSHNHCMLGHIQEWFYSGIAGIQPDPSSSGFRRILIRPQPAGDLTWAEAEYLSVRGTVSTRWRIEGDTFRLTVRVPAGSIATVVLPDGSRREAVSGEHQFTCPRPVY